MNRGVLRFCFFILLLVGGIPTLAAQEIGLQLYSLRNQFKKDVKGTLDLIQSWGITKLEGGATYGMPLDQFTKELASRNLKVVSVGASFEELDGQVDVVIKNAKVYDARYVMCAWIPHPQNNFSIADVQKAIEVFNRAGKVLEEQGIQLTYHPHGYEFQPYGNGTLFDYMARKARYFKFEMDVYWVQHGGEDPMLLLNRYPNQFVLLHLKDMAKGVKGNTSGHEDVETNVVLGSGQVEIDKLVARAGELGIPYLFIEDESSKVVTQVPKSLKYLSELMKQ